MTKQLLLPRHPDDAPPEATPPPEPRGFLDCRGVWQDLAEDGDRRAAS